MRALALIVAALLGLAAPAAAERVVTDSAGRQVTLPDRIQRVFAAGPPASVLVYVLAPDMLAGWSRAATPAEREYLAAPYGDLPELGRLTGRGDTANLEVVLKVTPDLILDFGSVGDTYVSLANRVQEQTGIPYLLIDGRFANTAAALRLTGEDPGRPRARRATRGLCRGDLRRYRPGAGQGATRARGRGSTSPAARMAWRRASRARSTRRSSSA